MVEHSRPQKMVLWVLWLAGFSQILMLQFFLGGGIPRGADVPGHGASPIVVLAVGEVALAMVVRWLLLPRANATGRVLVLLIIGLAMCEGAQFLGLLVVPQDQPQTKLTLWLLALVGALQFAPFFAKTTSRDRGLFRSE